MIKLEFNNLKNNYSISPTSIHQCSMHFPNTCAIRMSEAIVKTEPGFLNVFKMSTKNKCPHSYVRGVQDLAAILSGVNALGVRRYGWEGDTSGKVPANVKGKKGIICYMNIPGYSGQGHIDLWDKAGPVGSDYWDAKTI